MENNSPVYLGVPTYDGRIDIRTARVVFTETSQRPLITKLNASSLLARNFNEIYCGALNARIDLKDKYDIKWFAMLHADIIPEPWWLDKMIAIAEQHGADLLSAVVPIKDGEGMTSTGISLLNETPFFSSSAWRFSQTEINDPNFPETFSINDLPENHFPKEILRNRFLLVNTGCMIMRLDQTWSDVVHFTINDRIVNDQNGYRCEVESEDWFLSRMVYQYGGKVMATKAISLQHVGQQSFHSKAVWGNSIDPKAKL